MAASFLIYSCGSNQSKESEKSGTDTSTAAAAAAAPAPAETKPVSTTTTVPADVMVVTHKVKDYAKWQASYDAHDSMKMASGVHNYVIGRTVQDSNTIVVATMVDDMTKAKAFATSKGLKDAMQKSGVVGAPMIKFYTLVFRDTAQVGTDLRSRTAITVKDWDKWQKAFDSTRQVKTDNGLMVRSYGHEVGDNHKVIIVSAITDTAKAMAYFKSDLVKQRMAVAGVTSKPDRLFYHMVKKY